MSSMKIKEVDIRNAHVAAPFRSILNGFAQGQEGLAKERAEAERLRNQSWARQGLLITEAAHEIDGILSDEELLMHMGIDRHARLADLVARLRRG